MGRDIFCNVNDSSKPPTCSQCCNAFWHSWRHCKYWLCLSRNLQSNEVSGTMYTTVAYIVCMYIVYCITPGANTTVGLCRKCHCFQLQLRTARSSFKCHFKFAAKTEEQKENRPNELPALVHYSHFWLCSSLHVGGKTFTHGSYSRNH